MPARTRSRDMREPIPCVEAQPSRNERKSDELQFDGLRPAPALVGLHLVGQLHALGKVRQSGALHGSDVHENVLAAALRRNESVALGLIEELDSTSLAHGKVTPSFPSRFPPTPTRTASRKGR